MISRVDHYGAIFDPVCPDKLGAAHCADHKISLPNMMLKIASPGVTDGDRCVGLKHHHRHGLTQNGAPANDHCVQAFQIDFVVREQTHDALWGGAPVGGFAHGHASKA